MGPKKPPLPPWLEHQAVVRKKLKDRGFRPADRMQVCESCSEYGEEAWTLKSGGQMGGRDISYCMNCGRSRSWKGSGETRRVEEPFDILGFLGIVAAPAPVPEPAPEPEAAPKSKPKPKSKS